MPHGEARAARINRRTLRKKLEEIQGKRAELERRDLNDRAREEEDRKLRKEARQEYDALVEKVRGLERAALERLRGITPAAQRRKAIFERPDRFAALVQALDVLSDEELPQMAEMAAEKSDHAALAALARTVTDRDPGGEIAGQVMKLADQATEGFAEAIAEAVVVRQEIAGMALDAGEALEDQALAKEALTLGHGAARVELEGRSFHYDDTEVAKLYDGLGIERAVESVAWPEPSGGTIHPDAVPAGPMVGTG